jgi:hypothetical protein
METTKQKTENGKWKTENRKEEAEHFAAAVRRFQQASPSGRVGCVLG